MTAPDQQHRSIWLHLYDVPFELRWVDVGGIRTRLLHAGESAKPALIMLHGTGGSLDSFCANIGPLSRHFDCYAFDLVGSGLSDKPDHDYEIAHYVEHVRRFMATLGIPRAFFLTVSLGSWITARLAIEHPALVQGAVMLAASGLKTDARVSAEIRRARKQAVEDPTWANVKAIFSELIFSERNRVDDLVAIRQALYRQPGMKKTIDHILCLQDPAIRARNLIDEEDWRRIEAPILVVGSLEDEELFLSTSRTIAKLIPNGTYVEMSEVGHWAHFEKPDEINRIVVDFAKGTG